jgi:hypothetical protein
MWWVAIPLVVLLAGSATSILFLRNRVTAIPIDETVDLFRADRSGGSGAEAPGLPVEGVYVYATDGFEETNALGGSRHVYPTETSMTLSHTACGYVSRWQPIGERWEEYDLCVDDGDVSIRNFRTYHQFFLKSDFRDYVCGSDPFLPASRPRGATWTARCETAADGSVIRNVVVGEETIVVGGQGVRATRLRSEGHLTGSSAGTRRADLWVHPETGLLLSMRVDIDLDTDSALGRVHYVERYEVTLTSLEPRR